MKLGIIIPIAYFLLWQTLFLGILIIPFAVIPIKLTDQMGLFFLASFPFAIASIFLKSLKPKYFLYFYIFAIVNMFLFYFSIGNFVNETWNITFIKSSWYPVFSGLAILFFFYLLISMGLFLSKDHDSLSIRRSFRDESEQGELFELKQEILPEQHLTFYKYKQLLNCGIGFVATSQNKILASIQSFVGLQTFFFYDLLIDNPEIEKQKLFKNDKHQLEKFLLHSVYLRPEIQFNKPENIVYIARETDCIWEKFLFSQGFEKLELESEDGQKCLQNMLEMNNLKIDEWAAFSFISIFYIKKMNYESSVKTTD